MLNHSDTSIDVLVTKEYLSPCSFPVQRMSNNRPLFGLKDKLSNCRAAGGEKRLVDNAGKILFRVVVNAALPHTASARVRGAAAGNPAKASRIMYLHDLRNDAVDVVRKKNFIPGRGRGTLLVTPAAASLGVATADPADETDSILRIVANFWRSWAVVVHAPTDTQIGIFRRKLIFAKKLIAGLDYYTVRVAPAADLALLAMLASCFDDHCVERTQ